MGTFTRMQNRPDPGFTLVELLVSLAIFVVVLGSMITIVDGARKAWERGESQVDMCQNGRALMGLLERDLRSAVVSDSINTSYMQFGQDSTYSVAGGETIVTNSNNLFWYAPATAEISGTTTTAEFYQMGWYLTQVTAPTSYSDWYRLKRMCRPLAHSTVIGYSASSGNAQKLYWLTSMTATSLSTASSVSSNTTIGFWVQCLDSNGTAIPQLYKYDPTVTGSLAFNSSSRFQMAPTGSKLEDGSTFRYTASSTGMANQLPDSVRIAFLLTDDRTMKRFYKNIPLPDATTMPMNLDNINQYSSTLAAKGIQTRLFSTTIKLINGLDH